MSVTKPTETPHPEPVSGYSLVSLRIFQCTLPGEPESPELATHAMTRDLNDTNVLWLDMDMYLYNKMPIDLCRFDR